MSSQTRTYYEVEYYPMSKQPPYDEEAGDWKDGGEFDPDAIEIEQFDTEHDAVKYAKKLLTGDYKKNLVFWLIPIHRRTDIWIPETSESYGYWHTEQEDGPIIEVDPDKGVIRL